MFFASLAAGFLQRSIVDPDIKSVEKVDYYLDTALVISLLGLSDDDSISYAKELISVIKGSGSCPRIHAFTAREVSNIFQSIIDCGGPWVGSAIETPYHNLGLTPIKLMDIKNSFIKNLEKIGVEFTNMPEKDIDAVLLKYRNNPMVIELAEQRGDSQTQRFRDIHDIYLHDYVKNINKNVVNVEKQRAYFVSINGDLVKLFKGRENPVSIIHSAKVVMNLWMHTSRSSFARRSALTLAISRCFAANKQDVRQKLNAVLSYYDPEKKRPSEEIQAIYTTLLHRSQNVMKNVEEIIENEKSKSPDFYQRNQLLAKSIFDVSVAEFNERKSSLAEMEALKSSIESVKFDLNTVANELKGTKESLEEKTRKLSLAEQDNKDISEKLEQEKKEKANLERKVKLQEEMRLNETQIRILEKDIEILNSSKQSYVKENDSSMIYTVIECAIIIIGLASISKFIYDLYETKEFSVGMIIGFCSSLVVYLIALSRGKSFIFDRERAKNTIVSDLENIWVSQNQEYKSKKSQLESLKNRVLKIENELKEF